ncbi:fucose mutarotase-like [Scleropages formosus]|uniref:L-fucose mutarotase n=1 Tax=Scleropages formosus TaxID=113540 RepID=A0A0P7WQF1_SCLFO|nr:fucose mutarotase-like [Scleropages formosus]
MVVLRGIPSAISPELLYALARMGHGDELGAEPHVTRQSVRSLERGENGGDSAASASYCAASLHIPELLEAVLKLFPLDTYVHSPAAVMDLVDSDKQRGLAVQVWETYSRILKEAGSDKPLEKVERFEFYERAKKAFAVVATGETSLYGNLIIKKGVIAAEDLC